MTKFLSKKEEDHEVNKMSRRCCCCIPIVVGATILGLIGLIFCAGELGLLIPYILGQYDVADVSAFNPIKDNLDTIFKVCQETLALQKESMNLTQDQIEDVMREIKKIMPTVLMGATIESGVYALSCLLMLIACCTKVRTLMLPYLILTLLGIIVLVLAAFAGSVALFFNEEWIVMGVVGTVTTIILAIFLIYFWSVVQRAFVELKYVDSMYSPVQTKPYPANDGRGAGYYPTSPQHFQMDERK